MTLSIMNSEEYVFGRDRIDPKKFGPFFGKDRIGFVKGATGEFKTSVFFKAESRRAGESSSP